jgi:hypothetical protein
MTQRFLAFLLFGMLGLVALDGFELRGPNRENSTPSVLSGAGDSSQAAIMDGGNPYPPVKKKF